MSNDSIAHALAGAGGGALSTIVTYPLLSLSTRAQTSFKPKTSDTSSETAELINGLKCNSKDGSKNDMKKPGSKKCSPSGLDLVRHIIAQEGIFGLYSGLESAIIGISATNFVYYYFYERTKAFYKTSKRKAGRSGTSLNMTTSESMLAGFIAGVATAIITNPIWVVNTRMTVRSSNMTKDPVTGKPISKPLGTIGTIQDLIKNEGFKPFFSGILPALVLVINPILQYSIFEQLKNVIEKRRKLRPLDYFLIGALGKIISTTITYPYITLKSRLQVEQKTSTKNENGERKNKSKSFLFGGILEIIQNEGVAGLYAGIVPKVAQSALSTAFLFLFKEELFTFAVALLEILKRLKQ